jgi:CubicO group peptidase (beta-lactamase class C family)
MSQPLQFPPGSNPNLKDANGNPRKPYSNFGYVLLGLVIEHVTTMSFINYLQKIVGPLGIADVFVAGTLMSQRRSNEALAEDPGLNVTALDPNSNQLLPAAYGGFVLETMDSGGGLIASTPSLVQLVHHYAAWGAAVAGHCSNG